MTDLRSPTSPTAHRRSRRTIVCVVWSLVLVVALLLGSSVSTQGQATAPEVFLAVGAGFPWDFAHDHLSPAGIVTQVRARKGVSEQLKIRGIAEWSRFGEDETGTDHLHAPCPPGTGVFGCHSPIGPLTIASFQLGLEFGRWDAAATNGAYFLLGLGYTRVNHVSLTDRNGVGWHVGGGFEGKGSHPSFIELQFHQTHGVDRSPTAGRVFQVMYGVKL